MFRMLHLQGESEYVKCGMNKVDWPVLLIQTMLCMDRIICVWIRDREQTHVKEPKTDPVRMSG